MPDLDNPFGLALEALGFTLFLPDENGALHLSGKQPDWLARLWPGEVLSPEASPFLENFLIDARECWRGDATRRVDSGPWIERDRDGGELRLQAIALTAGGRPCLLIERLGEAFDAKVSVLQKARETVIALQRLDSEIQKKEILVHCLAEDLSGALGNVVTSLRLMELGENSPRTAELLTLALRGTQEQHVLIEKVLALFADDLGGLYGRGGSALASADLRQITMRAVENVSPLFAEKGVRLATPAKADGELRVAVEASRFERVVANLLHNALDETLPGSEVAVRLSQEGDVAMLTIEHPGSGRPIAPDGNIGASFDPAGGLSPKAFLRLRFCRIAIENCMGEMGVSEHDGVNCVWIHLPKGRAAR